MKLTLRVTQNQIQIERAKICLWKIILWSSLYLGQENFILQIKLLLLLKDMKKKKEKKKKTQTEPHSI